MPRPHKQNKKQNHVCLHVTFTANGSDNCYSPRSSKAKGPSKFTEESRLGGGANSGGGGEGTQSQLGGKRPRKRGVTPGAAAAVRRGGGPRSLGGRAVTILIRL